MIPHIFEFTPFSVVGYPSRHTKAGVKSTADAPTFWNTIEMFESKLSQVNSRRSCPPTEMLPLCGS